MDEMYEGKKETINGQMYNRPFVQAEISQIFENICTSKTVQIKEGTNRGLSTEKGRVLEDVGSAVIGICCCGYPA